MPSLHVRQGRPSDNLDALSVKRAAIREAATDSYTPAQIAAWAPGLADLDGDEAALDSDDFYVPVAELGDAVVGDAVFDVDGGALLALYVQPGQRGTGVGSRLLGRIESTARTNGTATLALLASKNAVGFYEDQGYERDGTVTKTFDDESLPFVRMEKEL
jgi:putative acetyltransferase